MAHVQKIQGQGSVGSKDRVVTDRWTDTTDCSTFSANEERKNEQLLNKEHLSIAELLQYRQHAVLTAPRPSTEDKKLSYRRGTARCVVSIEILPIATQQYRNYLYDKS